MSVLYHRQVVVIITGTLLAMALFGCTNSSLPPNTPPVSVRETSAPQQSAQPTDQVASSNATPAPQLATQQPMQPQSKDQRPLTEAQRKIDSQLLAVIQQAQGNATSTDPQLQPIEIGADGKISIDIRAEVSDQLIERITALGADVIATSAPYRSITAMAPLDQIEPIAGFPEVLFIIPTPRGTTNTSGAVNQPETTTPNE